MNVAYVVDSDWIIDHFHGIERTTQKLTELKPAGIAMSIISLAELYEGVYYSRDPAKSQQILDRFLQDIPVLGIDGEICKAFGKERGRLRHLGRTISDFDLVIGATCLCYHLTLLSNNRRHCEMLENLRVLSLS